MLCHREFRSTFRDYVTKQPLWSASQPSSRPFNRQRSRLTETLAQHASRGKGGKIIIIIRTMTHLALLSSLQSSPGLINIHGKIHAEN